eukprot:gnl/TRDRNA2_/TRDRNA2_184877_c0_seq1.p1 gnl/TRDRNA2_/TRDRNA2_184877_c0~~gnl/TRDRNA2_/TRDRNA2_184877_c0_seq1.p1  ORF type:complete len:526 (+),score=64.57 gnl/TRDRNA2_/TRDRNA2_184877_c0_seq1:128-1705(+)
MLSTTVVLLACTAKASARDLVPVRTPRSISIPRIRPARSRAIPKIPHAEDKPWWRLDGTPATRPPSSMGTKKLKAAYKIRLDQEKEEQKWWKKLSSRPPETTPEPKPAEAPPKPARRGSWWSRLGSGQSSSKPGAASDALDQGTVTQTLFSAPQVLTEKLLGTLSGPTTQREGTQESDQRGPSPDPFWSPWSTTETKVQVQPAKYALGDIVEYKSVTFKDWITATVVRVNRDREIMIDLKPNVWLSEKEQDQQVRPLAIPNGPKIKSLYLVDDRVEYYSDSFKDWIPAVVQKVDDYGRVMVDVKQNTWLSKIVQESRLRPILPESNALYAVGDLVDYYSTSFKEWCPAEVTKVNADGRIMIDVKPNVWLPLEAQEAQVRAAIKYQKGDAVEYYSTSFEGWYPATVIDVDADGRLMVDVKQGAWLDRELQATQVRPVAGGSTERLNKSSGAATLPPTSPAEPPPPERQTGWWKKLQGSAQQSKLAQRFPRAITRIPGVLLVGVLAGATFASAPRVSCPYAKPLLAT